MYFYWLNIERAKAQSSITFLCYTLHVYLQLTRTQSSIIIIR